MNRRTFIKKSAFASLGGLLLPPVFLSSACRKQTLFQEVNYNGKVLIIGAGAAGLYAGYLLQSKGIDFQILEASSGYGGRMGKLYGFANFPIDLGAQWLHGKNNIAGDLITQSNTKISLDNSTAKYWFKNQLVDTLPQNTAIFEGDNLPDISFQEYAIQQGLGNDYKYIIEMIAGDQGADASRLSVYYNNKEEANWSSGDDDFKFQATYFELIEQEIARYVKHKITYNTVVDTIVYTNNRVTITDKNNNTYLADKAIITVPISILKANDIRFTPALPREKTSAFAKIGMDAGMKVFLKFNTKFFDQNIIGGSICAAYADDSVGKASDDNVLLAFIMGEQAEYLTALGNDTAIINALLQELDTMYNGLATASFVDAYVQNFTTNPYIKGAYSYSTIGMGNAREIAAQPVDNTLFFAGEAMNLNGHHQTVHGAMETAYREVINILNGIA